MSKRKRGPVAKSKPHDKGAKRRKPTAKQRAEWKAEKQKRGSPKPVKGRCGRHLKGTGPKRFCTQWPLKGRDSCKYHGGTQRRGAESEHFVHGQRSSLYADVLGGALRRGYESIQSDEDLLSCREQIRLWSGRERQLVEQLSKDGTIDAAAVRASMAKVDDVEKMPADTEKQQKKRGAALVAAWDKLRQDVAQLDENEKAWREVERVGRMLVRFRREERRLMEAKHAVLAIDKVLYLMALLTAVAMKYVTDPVRRSQFCEDAKLLAAGHPVEVDSELIAAVPFGRST